MTVQGKAVTGEEPDELARREDNFRPDPDRFPEQVKASEDRFEIHGLALQHSLLGSLEIQVGDEPPGNGGGGKADRGDEEGHVVAKPGDQGERGAEGTRRARNLVEDVYQSIETTEFLDVTPHDISGDDPADQFHHAVRDAGDAVDGDDAIGVVASIVAPIVLLVCQVPAGRLDSAAGASVRDQEDGRQETEDEDGHRQHCLGGETLDERGDQDRADALTSLVETGEEAQLAKRHGRRLVDFGVVVVSVRCKGDDGPVEGLEAKFVQHDPGNVDGNVPLLDGTEQVPGGLDGVLGHFARATVGRHDAAGSSRGKVLLGKYGTGEGRKKPGEIFGSGKFDSRGGKAHILR